MSGSIFRNNAEVKIDTSHYGKITGMAIYDPDLQRYKRGTDFRYLHVYIKKNHVFLWNINMYSL